MKFCPSPDHLKWIEFTMKFWENENKKTALLAVLFQNAFHRLIVKNPAAATMGLRILQVTTFKIFALCSKIKRISEAACW